MQIWPKEAWEQNNIGNGSFSINLGRSIPELQIGSVCTDEDGFEDVEIVAVSDQADVRLIIRGLANNGKNQDILDVKHSERI